MTLLRIAGCPECQRMVGRQFATDCPHREVGPERQVERDRLQAALADGLSRQVSPALFFMNAREIGAAFDEAATGEAA